MKKFIGMIFLLAVWGLALAQDFDLYVVDIGPDRGPPWQVIRYDENGQNPSVFINTELNRPQDIVFLEASGTALVSNLFSGRITRYDAVTGEFINDFATGIGQPTRMEIGADNLLYVLQWQGNGRVLRYQLDGTFVDEFTSVGVTNSIGMDWDAQGNLYVASFDGAHVRKFDNDGNDLGLFVSSNLQGPTNIWFAGNGDLMVLDWSGRAIRRFDANGTFLGIPVTGLNEPEGVDFLDNGNFLIGNGGTSAVKEYQADGTYVRDLVRPGAGGLVKPNAVRIRRLQPFQINAGLNDAWFNLDTAGQGVFVNVFPVLGKIFIAMFTFDTERPGDGVTAVFGEPGHRWVTAFGDFAGNTAVLEAELTANGIFNSGEPGVVQTPQYGTFTLTFTDCSTLALAYDFPTLDLAGTIDLTRVANDNVSLCEMLSG